MNLSILRSVRRLLVLMVLFAVTGACNDKPDEARETKPAPLQVSGHSSLFNESFSRLLTAYYRLKDAFVESDPAGADAATPELVQAAEKLALDGLGGDSTGTIRETATYFSTTIAASAHTLKAAPDIEAKRKEFEMITDAMWSLTRTVQYSPAKVYYQYCPMAFDNKGAYWLSQEETIRNPYFGSKMLACGETRDSLDYSKR